MKRKILTVIIVCMLTCVMCIVFFACNNTQNQNEPDSTDRIGVLQFAKENEFSFGKFEEDKIIAIGNRDQFGQRYDEANTAAVDPIFENIYALTLEDDIFFSETVARLQEKYDHYRSTDLGANLVEISFSALAERKVGALNSAVERRINVKVDSLAETSEKIVQKGEYTIYFDILLTSDYGIFGGDTDFNWWLGLDIWCTINKEGERLTLEAGFLIEFISYGGQVIILPDDQPIVSTEDPEHINDLLTQEDKLYIADGYFSALEEIVTAWLDDPRGQSYIDYIHDHVIYK